MKRARESRCGRDEGATQGRPPASRRRAPSKAFERAASGPRALAMRCARLTEHAALAVVKLGRMPAMLEPALAASLFAIAGVEQVHVDARRSVVQVLYDGRLGTVEKVHRLLSDQGWACKAQA